MICEHYYSIRDEKMLVVWCNVIEDIDLLAKETILDEKSAASFSIIKAERRKREWLTTRWLLHEIEPRYSNISYTANGKPFVQGAPFSLSITHSAKNVALSLDYSKKNVGIDCETRSERILKAVNKFCSESEKRFCNRSPLDYYTLVWSAKEAMFKTIDEASVDFVHQLEVQEFDFTKEGGTFTGRITKGETREITLQYVLIEDSFLVFTT